MQLQAPRKPADASDSFFGESGALDAPPAPMAFGPPGGAAPVHAPAGFAGTPASVAGADLAPAGVPKSGPNMMLLLVVGGGALLLGIIIVILLLAG